MEPALNLMQSLLAAFHVRRYQDREGLYMSLCPTLRLIRKFPDALLGCQRLDGLPVMPLLVVNLGPRCSSTHTARWVSIIIISCRSCRVHVVETAKVHHSFKPPLVRYRLQHLPSNRRAALGVRGTGMLGQAAGKRGWDELSPEQTQPGT